MKNRYLPFGYKIADGKIVADSEQVEAVRRIFDAYTAGQTFQQIADALSAQGIPYRSDASRWNKNMVSRILANADYCGTAEYPQIITAGQFEAAEQIRKSKTVTYSATLKPFRKDMHCGCCGARLYWHPKSNQWFCRECGMWSKPTQAEETFNSIVEKLRWLQQNPELIHPPAGKANATTISITHTINVLGGIEEICISDNGSGICFETIRDTFGAFLASQKNALSLKIKSKVNQGKG